jgi:hypothetical protein
VVVFANSKTEWSSLPPGAASLRSEGGGTIPMVFVTSADGAEGIMAITYDSLKSDIRKADRELRKKLETVAVTPESEPTAPGSDTEAGTGKLLAPSQGWSNADGKSITAAVAALSGTAVSFVMPNGSVVEYPLEKLSAESRDRLAKLTPAP